MGVGEWAGGSVTVIVFKVTVQLPVLYKYGWLNKPTVAHSQGV
jgi:hypothetical protein